MLKIRLTRVGKKNSPAYRVVVADKKRAVKGKFIEILGNYNPTLNPKTLVINKERALFWMSNGAQPSDTVNNLMVNLGILEKSKTVKKVYGKKFSKKAIKSGADKVVEAPAAEAAEATAADAEVEAPVEVVAPEEIKPETEAIETPSEIVPAEESAEEAEVVATTEAETTPAEEAEVEPSVEEAKE